MVRNLAWAVVLVLAASCGSAPGGTSTTTPVPRGGTLHVVVPRTLAFPADYTPPDMTTLDAVLGGFLDAIEVIRCCLGRTLLSYNGQSTDRGGAELHPDLAIAPPEISADGLAWTFHIRPNLHYAPPLQNAEIVAADFVRSLQRTARLGQGVSFSGIAGFDAYAKGSTQSIVGLETPDSHTLVVRLTAPQGDLGYRLSLPQLAPLPPLPDQPAAAFGVATGHDKGDSAFIVSSGPYMIEGADKVDLSAPPDRQQGAAGLVAGRSLTLVRNPSWSAATDPLRPAYADRIVITYGGTVDDAVGAVGAARQDIMMTVSPPPQVPLPAIRAYEDPSRGRVDIQRRDGVRYISMNLAVPPFDDVHVRRAVAFALDRTAIQQAFGGDLAGVLTGHLAPDSMEADQLLTYDPYRTSGDAARLSAARQEMARSRYDSRHSGTCDAAACAHVSALALTGTQLPAALGDIVRTNLAAIGITLDVTELGGGDFFQKVGDPTQRVPMALFWAYFKDYPNGGDYFDALFSSDAIASQQSYSLLGATAEQLRGWGYGVTDVPSVDDRINACTPLSGDAQLRCWTQLDQYMMEQVVATVPFVSERYVEIVPARVVAYSFDQLATMPALDRIAVRH